MKPDDITELQNKIQSMAAKNIHVAKYINRRVSDLEAAAIETDKVNFGGGKVFRAMIAELEAVKRML